MGNVISNLKVKFGIDTSDFKKGLKDGEKAMSDFKGAAGDSISEFSSLFGINMSGVTGAVGLATRSLGFLKQSFIGAKEGSEALAVSTKALKWVLASTGIGALVVVLASLATYFTKTTKGAKELNSAMTQLKAAGTVYLRRVGEYGGGLLEIFKGNFTEGFTKLKNSIVGIGAEMLKAAGQGKVLAQSIYDINKEERQFNVEKSEQLVTLEEFRLKSRDIELSAKERLSALNAEAAIEKKINKEAVAIAAERLLQAQMALQIDTQSKDKKDALAEAYVHYNETVAESIIFERSLARQKNTLIKEIRAEEQALLDLAAAFAEQKKDNSQVNRVTAKYNPNPEGFALAGKPMVETLTETSKELQEMYNTTEQSLENLATGFGEWVGAFASGMAGFRDLRQMVGNAFGDMLIALGNVAIKTGIGIEAIKAAFSKLGGVGSIAIGLGLVAFGSSIKGSLAQISNAKSAAATYSTSSPSGSTSGGSITSGAFSATPSKLKLEGTVLLKLTGADLLAILNNENTRVNIVT